MPANNIRKVTSLLVTLGLCCSHPPLHVSPELTWQHSCDVTCLLCPLLEEQATQMLQLRDKWPPELLEGPLAVLQWCFTTGGGAEGAHQAPDCVTTE